MNHKSYRSRVPIGAVDDYATLTRNRRAMQARRATSSSAWLLDVALVAALTLLIAVAVLLAEVVGPAFAVVAIVTLIVAVGIAVSAWHVPGKGA